jgi:DNA-directed RNA polymerase specialized sigma24 family protein
MNDAFLIFESHRQRLFGVAYRMLGSHAEAEDILQEAYLRWHGVAADKVRSPEQTELASWVPAGDVQGLARATARLGRSPPIP